MARIQHGDEMHRDGGGATGPFEDHPSAPGLWRFKTGEHTLIDTTDEAWMRLEAADADLGAGTDGVLTLFANIGDPGGADTAKHVLLGGHGLVVPILTADPASGASENGQVYYNSTDDKFRVYENGAWADMVGGGSGAPTTADYLVGTANGSLSSEIVVGTSPGGELGGTWASPTVDATHAGSAHHAPLTVQDEGTPLATAADTLDFVGAGVVASGTGGTKTITISGSSVADILDLPTAETDDTLVLAPDGAGGVEFRAEAGGSGVGNLWTMSKTTSQTLTSNADTLITFDRADIDGGGSVIDLANERFVAPATGFYLAIPHWIWEATAPNGAGRAQVFVGGAVAAPLVRLDGGTQGGNGSAVGTVSLSLTAGDFVTMACHPGAAVTPTARGNASRTLSTSFTLVRIT